MPYGWPQPKAPNPVRKWIAGQFAEIKLAGATAMHFSTFGGGGWGTNQGVNSTWWRGSQRGMPQYDTLVGDGSGTSIIEACVRWLARNFPQAPVRIRESVGTGEKNILEVHPMTSLIQAPNEHYDGIALLKATVSDLALNGNAYWLIVRAGMGRPVELWWIPSMLIEPRWPATDDGTFISYYQYMPGGGTRYEIDPADVIHFRDGIDPYNVRKGVSGIKSVLREVYTDEEASRFTSSLLVNMGVPGTIIAPMDPGGITQEEADQAKRAYDERTTGTRRGETIVFGKPTRIEQFGFNPQQMDLKALRRIPEERVSAVTGVPAIVAGLGAGLDRSTFANFAEARAAGYEEGIIPLQAIVAGALRSQLLVSYVDDLGPYEVFFDVSDIRILQEDETAKSTRTIAEYQGGVRMRSEARREIGLDAQETDDVYLFDIRHREVPATGELAMVADQPLVDLAKPGTETTPPVPAVSVAGA